MNVGIRFTFWFYACKLAGLLFITLFIGFAVGDKVFSLKLMSYISLSVLIGMCFTGAVIGLMLLFAGSIKMTCPFCGRYGDMGGDKEDGMWMNCNNCGFIHGTGFLKMRLTADKLDDEFVEDDDQAEE